MSFITLHKLCTYLLVFVGLLAILLPGELHWACWPASLFMLVFSWNKDGERIEDARYQQTWARFTIFAFFGFVLIGVLQIIPNPVFIGAYLLILLMNHKLFNRRENRDYTHIYLLSFLMLTLGTILNFEISYAFCFLFYLVFITWSLILFHLKREIEQTYLMRHEEGEEGEKVGIAKILQSKRLIRPSFLFSTSLIGLAVFLFSGTIFFMFPRVGFGLFFHRQRTGVNMSGFSNEVRLGDFGKIRKNHKVILRVEFPDMKPGTKPPPALLHYWRGAAFDRYDGRTWKRSRRLIRTMMFRHPATYYVADIPKASEKDVIKQIIYQEPLRHPVIFGIERVHRVILAPSLVSKARRKLPSVRREVLNNTLSYTNLPSSTSSLSYTVYSIPNSLTLPTNIAYERRILRRFRKRFLQLPKNFNPKIKALAERLTKDITSTKAKVEALRAYLQTKYKYSLERKTFTGPPIDNFLFEQKVGHCEYFSTALILLVRSLGIPARQVTGFRGANWNAFGNYYAVRQSHAHSWAEVLFKDVGWVRVDATPASDEGQSGIGWWRKVDEWLDSLRLRWYKWVIEYDLENQLSILRSIRDRLRGDAATMGTVASSSGKKKGSWKETLKSSLPYLGMVVLFFFFWFLGRRRGKRTTGKLTYGIASQLYLEALKNLGKKGFARAHHEAPGEFLLRLDSFYPQLTPSFALITERYLELRYDPSPQDATKQAELEEALYQLKHTLEEMEPLSDELDPSS